ncbi:hypothetical protein SPOG_05678 [Schizosaccharomyces cryophilus OY26]|uniref:Secreted protein n=1 Tax=Schizosaccharomyces cryophilus (strain OY26 / ATCC MYA-4695 / CBS 11777 / NBRC 106824 / NRRL Y48691) TaxID=653667 RepID=S9W2I0_SCHCR|nr:uncharacterized protein SPOG_05678 [Schizosaccharomyces cryophilus OY26]EPY52235.1 hypothetical protein SPOG_05678 [Schizosaccharomyces cryophilus OY26]
MLCIFLAALDQTVVTTSIVTIVRNLSDSSLFSWNRTAYSLSSNRFLHLIGITRKVAAPAVNPALWRFTPVTILPPPQQNPILEY